MQEEEIEVLDVSEPVKKIEQSKKEKRHLRRGEKLYITINLIVIVTCILFYGYRTIYYYKIEHNTSNNVTLKEKLTMIGNIVYQDDGLYEINDAYYYKGENVDNYVYYSGRLFRIIEINNGIKMISDDTDTNLIWGMEKNYQKSLIKDYLDKYLSTLKDNELYLINAKWCNNDVDVSNYQCNDDFESTIGLLSTKEYLNAGGQKSFLNNNSYFWTINYHDDKSYYVNKDGNINNLSYENDTYYSYGVRPVIVLSEDIMYREGCGTKTDPYIIEESNNALLKDNAVGSYVKYQNQDFRIMRQDEDGVLLILDGVLDVKKNYDDTIKYLNNDYLKNLDENDLVKIKDEINTYNYDNKYQYKDSKVVKDYYVVMPKVGDLFLNDQGDYWLNTVANASLGLMYTLSDEKAFFGDLKNSLHNIRPVIKLRSDIVVNDGKGTKDNPLVIGDGNEE